MYGESEWLDQQHGRRSGRRWRKLHLGLDADTQEIVAAELTPDDVGDVSVLPQLLDQTDPDIASLIADGAYDGESAYSAVAKRHPAAAVVKADDFGQNWEKPDIRRAAERLGSINGDLLLAVWIEARRLIIDAE